MEVGGDVFDYLGGNGSAWGLREGGRTIHIITIFGRS